MIPLIMPYFISLCMPSLTLSSTLRLSNRRMFWNVRATPRLFTCAVVHAVCVHPVHQHRAARGLVDLREEG